MRAVCILALMLCACSGDASEDQNQDAPEQPGPGGSGDFEGVDDGDEGESEPAPDDPARPTLEVWNGPADEVNATIASRIAGAGSGDTIRVSIFLMLTHERNQSMRDALTAAASQGASVEIISEGKNLDDPSRSERTQGFIDELMSAGASVLLCHHGCLVDERPGQHTSINHFKVYLLDIGGERTLIQSTANWTGSTKYESAAAINGDHYDEIWTLYSERLDLQRCHALAEAPSSCMIGGAEQAITPFNTTDFRWAKQGTIRAYVTGPMSNRDYQLNVLKNTEPGENCRIRIAMGHWTDGGRGMSFVDELNRLHAGGCDIDTVYGGTEYPALKTAADFEIEHQSNVHTKFMAIEADYYEAPRKLVWVGSSNFTTGSNLYDDETILRIDRDWAFEEFVEYFAEIEASD